MPGRCRGGGQAVGAGCALRPHSSPCMVPERPAGALLPTTPALANTRGTQEVTAAAAAQHRRATTSPRRAPSPGAEGAITIHRGRGTLASQGQGGGSGSSGVSRLSRRSRWPLGGRVASRATGCVSTGPSGAGGSWHPAPAGAVCVCSGMLCLTCSCPGDSWATSLPGNY